MTLETLQYFHFLRPFWLIGVLVALVLWYLIRPRGQAQEVSEAAIAPHLKRALQVGRGHQRKIYPIDGITLTAILLALAVAGPAWTRIANPLVADNAPLVVALKVTQSMETSDLAPTRLDRARFKISDLIAARAGARTALVAYAGSAHRVSPLTEDPNILRPLLEGLSAKIMPISGDRPQEALALASDILRDAEMAGAILFVLDDLDPGAIAAFNAETVPPRPPIVFLVAAPNSVQLAQLDRINNASVIRLTPDDRDLKKIEARVKSAYQAALVGDDRLAWEDRGGLLAWPIALLAVLWFRRGWTMRWTTRWSVIFLMLLSVQTPSQGRADGAGDGAASGWINWFLTPDQQGRIAFQNKKFTKAANLFQDQMWAAFSKYKAGQYEEAADIFARLDSADAAFAEGMSRLRFREYRPAIAAFETALARQPDFPEAARNLDISKAILDYVETTREQSDTGEVSGLGADDVVFDNEDKRGADTQIQGPSDKDAVPLSAEQWISSIDTDMGNFLRSRFVLDTAGRDK